MTTTALARSTDPVTSHLAAASVKNINETQQEVLRVMGLLGPVTDEKLVNTFQFYSKTKISPSGIRSRRAELVTKGLVEATALTGTTVSGRRATVWRTVRTGTITAPTAT